VTPRRIERASGPAGRRLWVVIAAALALAACSSGGARATSSGGGNASTGDDGGPTYAPTYHAVYAEVLSQQCLGLCHFGTGEYLVLDTEADGYKSLVGAPAQGPLCRGTGLERVAPGRPFDSLLVLKITDPPCGSRMPLDLPPLSTPQIDQIGQWIACGALDGNEPCPPDAGFFAFDGGFFATGEGDATGE